LKLRGAGPAATTPHWIFRAILSTPAAIAKEAVGATEAADCALNHSVEAAWYVVVLDVLDSF